MKTKEFINHIGGVKAACRFLDVHPSSIYAWGEVVPKSRAYEIFVRTDFRVPLEKEDYERTET
jgi:hypothetical protein